MSGSRFSMQELRVIRDQPENVSRNAGCKRPLSNVEKKKMIRSFFSEPPSKKCKCGGIKKQEKHKEKDKPPHQTQQAYKAYKRLNHTPAQLNTILRNPFNEEWIRHCAKCGDIFCLPCRKYSSPKTAISLASGPYTWIVGIEDGAKYAFQRAYVACFYFSCIVPAY